MLAKVIKVSKLPDGTPIHCFRVGEIVEIKETYGIPLNDGKGGAEYSHEEAYCVDRDGTAQGVAMDNLEVIS
jgi:hypothetical protein